MRFGVGSIIGRFRIREDEYGDWADAIGAARLLRDAGTHLTDSKIKQILRDNLSYTIREGSVADSVSSEVNWSDILDLATNPQNVSKTQARWVLPNNCPIRRRYNSEHSNFGMLWADIDNPPSGGLDGVVRALKQSTPFLIYTTKSATFEAQKCRILMPLLQTVDFETWLYCQGKLNKTLLNSAGIKADPCNLNPSQILFLPNKGAYYNHNHRVGFLKEKTRAVAIHHPTMAEVKPIQPRSTPPGGSVIDRFNVAYSVADILRQAGYSQCPYDPLKWRHPNSESGSYSATINPKAGLS